MRFRRSSRFRKQLTSERTHLLTMDSGQKLGNLCRKCFRWDSLLMEASCRNRAEPLYHGRQELCSLTAREASLWVDRSNPRSVLRSRPQQRHLSNCVYMRTIIWINSIWHWRLKQITLVIIQVKPWCLLSGLPHHESKGFIWWITFTFSSSAPSDASWWGVWMSVFISQDMSHLIQNHHLHEWTSLTQTVTTLSRCQSTLEI